ncbi:MAG: 7-cyano-7-deazaguanine synthase QueC [Burkholderiaceae bacterium]|jgi:7-cyano-7-deazaguanine synthase|nr:7-cyano-7-deazaguanine synthase QueC [Burkholderiaceae bacterium]
MDSQDTHSAAALVLFSGGQDSTTCLAWALARFGRVETVGFDYGQRHAVELAQRGVVLRALRERFALWRERLGQDHMLDAGVLGQISQCALTRETAFAMQEGGLPNTFVPGRNLLFCTLAGALAYRRALHTLVLGVSETDYSGYPDCRDATIKAMQQALSLGMARPIVIETPLMRIDKAATWQLARDLGQQADPEGGGDALVQLIVEHSHTCYAGDRTQRHPWGWGCGRCPACQLRAAGWANWERNFSRAA